MNSSEPGERVYFVAEESIRMLVSAALETHRRILTGIFPEAEIQHVGSTAVPGSLTKGDLDIQLRVRAADFRDADAALARHYRRNIASTHTSTFSSFLDDLARPALGLQLTVIDGPEDRFCLLRDHFLAHLDANQRYNDLKRQFDGGSMIEYRAAKSEFLTELLKRLSPPSPS